MSVPIEVAQAQKLLSEPLRFGDTAQVEALRTMERWHELRCEHCNGRGSTGVFEIRCAKCEGAGWVWVRK